MVSLYTNPDYGVNTGMLLLALPVCVAGRGHSALVTQVPDGLPGGGHAAALYQGRREIHRRWLYAHRHHHRSAAAAVRQLGARPTAASRAELVLPCCQRRVLQQEQRQSWPDDPSPALLERIGPAGCRQLALQISREMRKRNMRRMQSQRGPDGAAWEKRKKTRRAQKPIRYVYRKKDGSVREIEMSSYRSEGGRIIGYDKEARGIRTMLGERVLRKAQPHHGSGLSPADKRRTQKMMMKLGSAKWLKAEGDASAARVPFAPKAQRIAKVHHHGQRDKVNRRGTLTYDYPARELLGLADEDLEIVSELILARVAGRR